MDEREAASTVNGAVDGGRKQISFDSAWGVEFAVHAANLGRNTSSDCKGLTKASLLVQSLSREVGEGLQQQRGAEGQRQG